MSPKLIRAPVACGLLILAAASTGCDRLAPVAPMLERGYSAGVPLAASHSPEGAPFPLTIGNRWRSVSDDRFRLEPLGGGPPADEFTIHSDITRILIGTEILFGRSYVVEEETAVQASVPDTHGPWTTLNWIRFRQDGTGLYEADVATSRPPALGGSSTGDLSPLTTGTLSGAQRPLPSALASRLPDLQRGAYEAAWSRLQARATAVRSLVRGSLESRLDAARPGGLLEDEITRLRYPLHPGASWAIRVAPSYSSTVEAVESLDLPAGRFQSYRIRVDSGVFGPEESVRVWFGRSGLLAMRMHLVSTVTDLNGNVIGRLVDDSDEALHDLTLLRP